MEPEKEEKDNDSQYWPAERRNGERETQRQRERKRKRDSEIDRE